MDLVAHWIGIAAIVVFALAYALVITGEFTQLRKSAPVTLGAGFIWTIIAQLTIFVIFAGFFYLVFG